MARLSKYPSILLVVILAVSLLIMVKPARALNSTEHMFGSTSFYGIDGYGVNITVSVNEPRVEANSTILSFNLKVLEPFNARGIIVNQTDYHVNRKTLDFYFLAGVLLDYDRSTLINTLWSNWADTSNATYVREEKKLYSQNIWLNLTKTDSSYIGSAVLPKLQATHNATFWIRAEQDQVTTYIPLWAAFPKTITLTNQEVSPSQTAMPSVPEVSWLTILPLLVLIPIALVIVRKRLCSRNYLKIKTISKGIPFLNSSIR